MSRIVDQSIICRHNKIPNGMSLFEVLIILVIVASAFMVSVETVTEKYRQYQFSSSKNQFWQLLTLSRQLALSSNQYVVLCPTKSALQCADSWSHPVIAFFDYDKNGRPSVGERIIDHLEANAIKIAVNRNVLRFSPANLADNITATVTVCHRSVSTLKAAIVISNVGRIRQVPDSTDISCD